MIRLDDGSTLYGDDEELPDALIEAERLAARKALALYLWRRSPDPYGTAWAWRTAKRCIPEAELVMTPAGVRRRAPAVVLVEAVEAA